MEIKNIRDWRLWLVKRHNEKLDPNFIGNKWPNVEEPEVRGFFEVFHGIKSDVTQAINGVVAIAQSSQVIFEFIQNAVDEGATELHFILEDNQLTVANNGRPFSASNVETILNQASSEKKEKSIGKFGIGFKLIHKLVYNNQVNDLVEHGLGPIIFSWTRREQLVKLGQCKSPADLETSAFSGEPQKWSRSKWDEKDIPWLFKILLTSVPVLPAPHETGLRNHRNEEAPMLFAEDEFMELRNRAREILQAFEANDTPQSNTGSIFQLRLAPGKSEYFLQQFEEFKNVIGISTLFVQQLREGRKPFETISMNGKAFKQSEQLKLAETIRGRITIDEDLKNSLGVDSHTDGDVKEIEFAFAYPSFAKDDTYFTLTETANFFKFFPMMEEARGLNYATHCDLFKINSNRREFEDGKSKRDRNNILLELISNELSDQFQRLSTENFHTYCEVFLAFATSRFSGKSEKQWIDQVFHTPIWNKLKKHVPTQDKTTRNADNCLIRKAESDLNPSDFGIEKSWFFYASQSVPERIVEILTKADLFKEADLEYLIREGNEEATNSSLREWRKSKSQKYDQLKQELSSIFMTSTSKNFWKKVNASRELKRILGEYLSDGNEFRDCMILNLSFAFDEQHDPLIDKDNAINFSILKHCSNEEIWTESRQQSTFLPIGCIAPVPLEEVAFKDTIEVREIFFKRSQLTPKGQEAKRAYDSWNERSLKTFKQSTENPDDIEALEALLKNKRTNAGAKKKTIFDELLLKEGELDNEEQFLFLVAGNQEYSKKDLEYVFDGKTFESLNKKSILTNTEKHSLFEMDLISILAGKPYFKMLEGQYAEDDESLPAWLNEWIEEDPKSRRALVFGDSWDKVHSSNGLVAKLRSAILNGKDFNDSHFEDILSEVCQHTLEWIGRFNHVPKGGNLSIFRHLYNDTPKVEGLPLPILTADEMHLDLTLEWSNVYVWSESTEETLENYGGDCKQIKARMIRDLGFRITSGQIIPNQPYAEVRSRFNELSSRQIQPDIFVQDLDSAQDLDYSISIGEYSFRAQWLEKESHKETIEFEENLLATISRRKVIINDEDIYFASITRPNHHEMKQLLEAEFDNFAWAFEDYFDRKALKKALNKFRSLSEEAERQFKTVDEQTPNTFDWLKRMVKWELEQTESKSKQLVFNRTTIIDEGEGRIHLSDCTLESIPSWTENYLASTNGQVFLSFKISQSNEELNALIEDVSEHVLSLTIQSPVNLNSLTQQSVTVRFDNPNAWLQSSLKLLSAPELNESSIEEFLDEISQEQSTETMGYNHIVYGPPGTGKTTKLIDRAIKQLEFDISSGKNNSIVVFITPTNPAAQAIADKFRSHGNNGSEPVRTTTENNKSKLDYDIQCHLAKNGSFYFSPFAILATTAHRLMVDNQLVDRINTYDNVRIVFDESSMLSLPLAVSCLLRISPNADLTDECTLSPLTIAGDPFQLLPVGQTPPIYDSVSTRGWSNQNWFTHFEVNDFQSTSSRLSDSTTVEPLLIQYRMPEAISDGISRFCYSGHLRSSKKEITNLPLSFDAHVILARYQVDFDPEHFSISSARIHRKHQTYHVGATMAALTIVHTWAKNSTSSTMAVISPYSAQTTLIQSICAEEFPSSTLNRLTISTVHRMQGNEADLVVLVNVAPKQMPGNTAFFNNQNLLNVAVSRTKKQLVVIHPDDIARDKFKNELYPHFLAHTIEIKADELTRLLNNQSEQADAKVEIVPYRSILAKQVQRTPEKTYTFIVGTGKSEESKPVSVVITQGTR